jgi:[ribosomal protein S5]-alanine N-acetyltransferase
MMPGVIETARLILREPVRSDVEILRNYYTQNASRFERWEPERGTAVEAYERLIDVLRAQRSADVPMSFLAFDRHAGSASIAGVVALSGFTDVPPGAMLDYSVDAAYEGGGYASEAVTAVLAHAASTGLVQFTAHYDPANRRSSALLARLGFRIIAETPGLPGLVRAQVIAIRDGAPVG